MSDRPACLATKNVHGFPLPGGECRGVNHHDGCHGHIDTSHTRCHAHVPVSLLDQIHAARSQAEANGQPEFARWLTEHADEACPAAIAQAMRSEEVNEAIDLVEKIAALNNPYVGVDARKVMPLIAALADAEERAKERDDGLHDATNANATLTRQLETAHQTIASLKQERGE